MIRDIFLFYYDTFLLTGFFCLAALTARALLRSRSKKIICTVWTVLLIYLLFPITLPFGAGIGRNLPNLQQLALRHKENTLFEASLPEIAGNGIENPSKKSSKQQPASGVIPGALTTEETLQLSGNRMETRAGQEYKTDSDTASEQLASGVRLSFLGSSYSLISILPGIWFLGVLCLLIRQGIRYVILMRKCRCSIAAEGQENVRLWPDQTSACVIGILHPAVYLPAGLSKEDSEMMICHENTHIRRWDPLRSMLWQASGILHWMNPLAHAVLYFSRNDMEMACDEEVLENRPVSYRISYAKLLLSFSVMKKEAVKVPLSFGYGRIRDRIARSGKHFPLRKESRIAAAVLSLLVLSGSLLACGKPSEMGTDSSSFSQESTKENTTSLLWYAKENGILDMSALLEDQLDHPVVVDEKISRPLRLFDPQTETLLHSYLETLKGIKGESLPRSQLDGTDTEDVVRIELSFHQKAGQNGRYFLRFREDDSLLLEKSGSDWVTRYLLDGSTTAGTVDFLENLTGIPFGEYDGVYNSLGGKIPENSTPYMEQHLDPEGNLVTSELDLGGAYDESGLYILPAYGYEIIYGDGWNCIPSTGEYFYDSDRYPEDEPYPWEEYLVDGHFPWESEEMAGSLPIRGQSGSDSIVNPGGITFPVPAGAKTVEEANHMAQLSQGDRLSAEVLAQMQEEGRLSWEDFAPFQKWEEEAAAQAGARLWTIPVGDLTLTAGGDPNVTEPRLLRLTGSAGIYDYTDLKEGEDISEFLRIHSSQNTYEGRKELCEWQLQHAAYNVLLKDGEITEGLNYMRNFQEMMENGLDSMTLTVAYYWTMDDRSHLAPEYIEENERFYPTLSFVNISRMGEDYVVFEWDEGRLLTYRYLICSEEEAPTAHALFERETVWFLSNKPDVTWRKITEQLLSSTYKPEEEIDYYWIASLYKWK